MFSSQSVKYTPLANQDDDEQPFNFASAFNYDKGVRESKFQSNHNYNSAFKYSDGTCHLSIDVDEKPVDQVTSKPPGWLVFTSWALTFLSYLFFVLTAPVSYCFFVKKMGEFDRLVVFRLGKMIGVKGPGRVLIFPWMDRTKKIDVRASAFSVPPQQFITCDGGIVEMGAEIQYGIVDVVTMISEVADHQDILRSLSKTLLIKILVKRTVQQLERDKRKPASDIQDELNNQVRKWGIDIRSVTLSEVKILKQAEDSSKSAIGSILKGLGMKGEAKYPTPEEFVRASQGMETDTAVGCTPVDQMFNAAGAQTVLPSPNMNMQLLQMMSSGAMPGGSNQVHLGPGIMNAQLQESGQQICNWRRCLEVIIQQDFSGPIDDDAFGIYKMEITETEKGTDVFYIELSPAVRTVTDSIEPGRHPDVSVTISSSDLAGVLDGSVAPLQAYLTGRISAQGDVKKLMMFDKMSKRGHKQGTMFNV